MSFKIIKMFAAAEFSAAFFVVFFLIIWYTVMYRYIKKEKDMKKKILCVFLVSAILFSLCASAFAEESGTLYDTMLKTPAAEYNNELALMGLGLSEITYYGEAEVRNYLESNFGFEDADIYTKNFDSSLAFAAAVKDYDDCSLLVIAARGTQTEYELRMDTDTEATLIYKDYPVYDFINDFKNEIFGGIEKVADKNKTYKVFVCGHSLGGAAANLTAAQIIDGACDAVNSSKDDVYCYTYGAIDSISVKEPVTAGYEGVHNVYNDFDTFSPMQYGFMLTNGIGSKVGKFGVMDDFSYDFRNEEQRNKGSIDQILEYINHTPQSYRTALQKGMVSYGGAEPSDWAKPEIEKAKSMGFVPEALFNKPREDITREEFAHMAVTFMANNLGYEFDEFEKVAGSKTDEVLFDDTDNPYVLLAARCGIVEGVGDNKFAPQEKITREQAATMLYRTYTAYCTSVSTKAWTDFIDMDSISDWAEYAVRFCSGCGVMNGYTNGDFGPLDNYTVEQSVATFVRMGAIEDWKESNFQARFVRKMTKEEAVAEYEKMDWQSILERFESPFGTVLYTVTGGIPHAGTHALILVRNDGLATGLLKDMPKADGWGKTPELEDLSYNGDNTVTFKMTFSEKADGMDFGDFGVLHEAGTYYYEVDLKTEECRLLKLEPAS